MHWGVNHSLSWEIAEGPALWPGKGGVTSSPSHSACSPNAKVLAAALCPQTAQAWGNTHNPRLHQVSCVLRNGSTHQSGCDG